MLLNCESRIWALGCLFLSCSSGDWTQCTGHLEHELSIELYTLCLFGYPGCFIKWLYALHRFLISFQPPFHFIIIIHEYREERGDSQPQSWNISSPCDAASVAYNMNYNYTGNIFIKFSNKSRRAPVHAEHRWTLKTLKKSVQHALYDSVYTKFPGKKSTETWSRLVVSRECKQIQWKGTACGYRVSFGVMKMFYN